MHLLLFYPSTWYIAVIAGFNRINCHKFLHYTTVNFNKSFLFLKFPFSAELFLARLKSCCTTVGIGGIIRVGVGVGESKMSKFCIEVLYVMGKA